MADEKIVKYDVDGYDSVTSALMELLNQYPALEEGEKITFSALTEESGISVYPINGAVIEDEKRSITGKVYQTCVYPFFIIYRVSALSSKQKQGIKEWLDNLGRWLEKQPIMVDEVEHQLTEYPSLTDTREMVSITRQSPAYLDNTSEGKVEDWAIQISARYKNQFKK